MYEFPSCQVNVTVVQESPSRKPRRRRTLSGSGSDSSYATDSGDEAGSNLTTPVASLSPDELTMRWRTYSLSSLNKEEKGNIPRVKEVKGAANMGPNPGKSNMRKTYVAVTNFTPTQAGELSLAEGDLVEGEAVFTCANRGVAPPRWSFEAHTHGSFLPRERERGIFAVHTQTKLSIEIALVFKAYFY